MPITERHPLTGVELNVLWIQRETLNQEEAVTAWIMRDQGDKTHEIAARLGTSAAQLHAVFRGDLHPEAKAMARREATEPACWV